MLKLYWADEDTGGWFLQVPGEDLPRRIDGPSLCTSTGGGAIAALEVVRELENLRFFYETINISQVPHLMDHGGDCNDPICFGIDPYQTVS